MKRSEQKGASSKTPKKRRSKPLLLLSKREKYNQKKSRRLNWEIDLALEHKVPKFNRLILTSLVQNILRSLELPPPLGVRTRFHRPFPPKSVRTLSISFTSDEKMRELNLLHRKKDKTTDVLSFPSITHEDYEGLASSEVAYPLGDIVISMETAVDQAKRYGWKLSFEVLRLLIHGILHLLGYDHERVTKNIAGRMRRLEKILFARHRKEALGLFKN